MVRRRMTTPTTMGRNPRCASLCARLTRQDAWQVRAAGHASRRLTAVIPTLAGTPHPPRGCLIFGVSGSA